MAAKIKKLTKKEQKALAHDDSAEAKTVRRMAKAADVELPAPTKAQKERAQKCLAQIEKDARTMTSAFYDLAVHIHEAYEGKYAQLCGYENFEEYAEKHLPFGYRQAMNFKDCGAMIKRLNIPKERVERIGMTKFKELLPSFEEAAELPETKAAQVVEKILDKGEKKSVRELQAEFQRQRAKPATPERFILRNLVFDVHQGSIVADALKVAYAEIGAENNVDAIAHICDEWLTLKGEGGVATTLEDHIALIERKFKVKLSVVGGAKQEKAKDTHTEKPIKREAPKPAPVVEDTDEDAEIEIDLDEMDKDEMLELIREHNLPIKGAKNMTEKQLRKAIEAALAEMETEDDSSDDTDDALLQELGRLT